MKPQIVRVVLNSEREDDREILDYLRYAGKPMSKLFKQAMRQFIANNNGTQEEVSLANIRKLIREELRELKISGTNGSLSEPSGGFEDDSDISPFDFLDAMEKMGND